MKIVSAFRNIDRNLPTAIFIRHGEKCVTSSVENDAHTPLSINGIISSSQLGERLMAIGCNISKIMSSPVQRCLHTAQILIKGNRSNLSIEEDYILKHAFIENPERAYEVFCTLQMSDIVRKQVMHEDLNGFRSIFEGSTSLVNLAISRFEGNKTDIYITHDLLLTTLFFALTNTKAEKIEGEWFDYLDGICLQLIEKDKLRICRETQVFDFYSKFQLS